MGLAIVRGIVEAHGGRIWIEDVANGSRFVFDLPLKLMSETKKIFVVDDEAQIIRVIRRILSAHHYDIRTASDGESGFELFQDWQPDLVVTDLQMPNTDGLELCRKLREILTCR
jgi:PleD family two-component response regulator